MHTYCASVILKMGDCLQSPATSLLLQFRDYTAQTLQTCFMTEEAKKNTIDGSIQEP